MTAASDRTSLNTFPPASEESWRGLAEKALKGAPFDSLTTLTRDGIVIAPLHARAKDAPVLAARAGAWEIVQRIDHPNPEAANRQALADLAGGANGLALVFQGAASGAGFGLPASQAGLEAALSEIELEAISLRLEPGEDAGAAARAMAALAAKQGLQPGRLDIAFGIDPIGHAARFGEEADIAGLGGLFKELAEAGFAGPFLTADGRVYHGAGASEAQELGAVLATVVAYLRALETDGVEPQRALSGISVTLAAGHDQFPTIAKFRAMRLLWRRLCELCGGQAPLRLHGETARRMMMAADAHTNLIRTTIAAFAAAAGGADSVSVLPYSAANGLAEAHARRLARNIQHLLMAESGVHHLDDPAAGSGAVEALTDALAEKGWAEFQAIEKEGGMAASLACGALAGRIEAMREAMLHKVRAGETPFVGATIYPNPKAPDIAILEAARAEAASGLAPLGAAEIARETETAETSAGEGAKA
ncbi:methylmalonyl-CoA mutase family protein [Afifella pfennigii]|uniref:methylmalonyl-CoA mutase family protein n=1 Tax=Afifella pfennigii TaxID=209897 RepID=UPI00068D9B95|nr:methylmalonyl-CoA mutase family protein [Afifella pfennigii]